MLSDSESEGDSIHRLTVNEHYAKAFQFKKEREELDKLKEKYGSDVDEEDEDGSETNSEEAGSEDEYGEELTPAVDAAILRTLAKIKRKDTDIYNADKGIFEEEQKKIAPLKTKPRASNAKSKPVTIRQAALEAVLQASSRSPSPAPITHVAEQRALRDETINAFQNAVHGEVDDNGDFLVLREKTKDEQEKEEEEYHEFLQREVGGDLTALVTVDDDPTGVREKNGEDGRQKKKKGGKHKGTNDGIKESDQEFLMRYILDRGWIDRSARRVPTYKEVTSSTGEVGEDGDVEPPLDLSKEHIGHGGEIDEDEFEDVVDAFETSYNFRFEEPDATMIKTYPRNIPNLVRREDTSRKEARERKKARKEEELRTKREEVKRLKRLKMKDLRAKLERIGRDGGTSLDNNTALQELDLDGDWDPDAHDKQMAAIFDNDVDEPDAEKPQWDDDIDIGDIVAQQNPEPKKESKKKKKKTDGDKDTEGVDLDKMDADLAPAPGEVEEEWDGTEEMRKRKIEEYMDEIYGLEFNDMVAGMPTRFRYAKVAADSYSLTAADILVATDAELNQYIGVKKYAPYRTEQRWDPKRGERLHELKQVLEERGVAWGGEADRPVKKRKGKKERMKAKELAAEEAADQPEEPEEPENSSKSDQGKIHEHVHAGSVETGSRKRKRKRHKNVE